MSQIFAETSRVSPMTRSENELNSDLDCCDFLTFSDLSTVSLYAVKKSFGNETLCLEQIRWRVSSAPTLSIKTGVEGL